MQPGQLVAVTSYIGKEELTRRIAEVADSAAKYVDVVTFDQWVKRTRIAHAAEDTLDYTPRGSRSGFLPLRRARCAHHASRTPPAAALEGLDPARAGARPAAVPARDRRRRQPHDDELDDRAGADTPLGQAVYPELEPADAYERLWEAVAHVCRLDDDDPVAGLARSHGG